MRSAAVAALLVVWAAALDALRCYCTDDSCVPYGVCEGELCFVGILRHSNQVIRTCAESLRPVGCQRDEDAKWTDLCACDSPFCNTFAYLRSHTRRETGAPVDDVPALVFHRQDRPDLEPWHPKADAPLTSRNQLLTFLLVGVPLTVGAATVLVVAFNYYCHLC